MLLSARDFCFFINKQISTKMKEIIEKVVSTPTKKKYVKPDFEVIELNMEAPLLSASGPVNGNTTLGSSTYNNL